VWPPKSLDIVCDLDHNPDHNPEPVSDDDPYLEIFKGFFIISAMVT